MAMNQSERKLALGLAGIFSFRMLGLFMILPVFVLYAPELQGYSPALAGIAIGIYGLSQGLLQIPFGLLSDRFGRKPIIYTGLVIFALGSALAMLADSMLTVIVGRVLQGAGAVSSAVMALAADGSRETERPKVMAVIGISIGLSFMLAMVLGPVLAAQFGLMGVFGFSLFGAVCAMALLAWLVPDPQLARYNLEALPDKQRLQQVLNQPQLWVLNLGVALLHFCLAAWFQQVPQQFVTLGLARADLWHALLPAMVLSFVGLGLWMRAFKLHTKRGMQLAAALMCMLLLQPATTSVVQLLLLMSLFFIGFNYLEAMLPSLLSSIAPAGARGSAMGVFATCQFLGAFAGGAFGGFVRQYSHTDWPLVLVLAFALMLWIVFSKQLVVQSAVKTIQIRLPKSQTGGSDPTALFTGGVGILEVVWIADSQQIYLKVDPTSFKREWVDQKLATLQTAYEE